MTNILITSAGQRVSLVKFFQKELRKIDVNAKVFTVDLNPVLAPACHISDGFKRVSRVTETTYINNLIKICNDWKIKMVIPTIDTELKTLSSNKKQFKDNGIQVIVSSNQFVKICRDKRISNSFFVDKGLDIPKNVDKYNPTFPLFVKPFDGSLSKDTFLIESKAELTDYHLSNRKFMFMEYINPKEYEEFTIDTYYNRENKLCCVVPRKRIFVRSGEVNKGVTRKNEIVTFFRENLSNIKGAIGCLTFQVFFNDNTKRIIGIEINPRFGGGYPLSYLAGANFPKWLMLEYFFNKKIGYTENWEDNLLMLRYDDEILVHGYEE